MKYKLLVIDVDGTLVDGHGNISTEDREALTSARSLGIQVSLSTGRVVQSCLGIIEQLSLDGYHIFFDGALISNPGKGKEAYAWPLKPELVRQAVEFARSNDMYIELYSTTGFFTEQKNHWSIDIHRQFFGVEPTVVDFAELWHKERIIKAELVVSSPAEIAKAETFQLHFEDSLRFSWAMTPAYPDVHFVNVVDPDVSKGKALGKLASCSGTSLAEVAVVGDGANDITLLAHAGLAIAMGNASDEVKAMAHHITLDIDHSGLAAAIDRFLL